MKNQINIAELLEDCPKGMELYSPIFGKVYLDKVRPHLGIVVTTDKYKEEFLYDGRYGMNGECMLFPSKDKTTWEGFHKPFEDGDIVAYGGPHLQICIFKDKKENNTLSNCYLMLDVDGDELFLEDGMYYVTRFATEEEKKILFDAIKENGYRWNPETKTLEKLPKFKIGDKIIKKNGLRVPFVITGVSDYYYWSNTENSVEVLPVAEQDDWELVPDKFDITTLKPFESKVLVRDTVKETWKPDFFGCLYDSNDCPYMVVGGIRFKCCIPYEGNEHLLNKTEDCNEFYKNW